MLTAAAIVLLASLPQDSLLVGIQQRLDARRQARAGAVYSCVATAVIRELDGQGRTKKADTVVSWQKFKGDSLLKDSTISTTYEKGSRKGGGKHEERVGLPELTDTSYVFQVLPDDRVSFKTKRQRKGDLSGQLAYDPATLDLRRAELTMPRPKIPVKSFAMDIDWEPYGGMLLPARIRMRASWKLLVISGRMEMEILFSDYTLY
jgi:hypothetical protein